MIRSTLVTIGLIIAWTFFVLGMVLVEAAWFAEPNIARGDISSIGNHIHSHLEHVSIDGSLGAAAMALIQNGEIVLVGGYGYAGTVVDAEKTLFQVGSVSKAVTAFGVMKLVQEGEIGLDEPVIHRLERWRFAGSDERRDRVTVRHLLSHTAGIDDPPGYNGFARDDPVQTLEQYLAGVRISREPGSEFVYGNAASAILQLLIEDVTGEDFATYMARDVLRPLGMTNSTFDFDTAEGNLAPAFDQSVTQQSPRRHSIPAAVAFYTSGRDLGRFAIGLSGANPVLNEDSMRTMMQAAPATGGTWGLGLSLFTDNGAGGHILGHDGGAQPSWGAMLRFNPATRNGMVAAISGGGGAANQLAHDWVYWETGTMTNEARRQVAYGRARQAIWAVGFGALVIIAIRIPAPKDPEPDSPAIILTNPSVYNNVNSRFQRRRAPVANHLFRQSGDCPSPNWV